MSPTPILVLLVASLAAVGAYAQQRNPWDDLMAPRQTIPQQQRQPQQQPPQQLPPQPPQQQQGIQTAPLPAPGQQRQQQALPDPNQPPQIPGQKGRPAATKQLPDVTPERAPEQRVANPTAVFSGLDKITGRIFPFEAAVNETVQFGALQVTPRACYTRPPTEPQNTTGFVQVDEITLDGKMRQIFNGWMFATSPGLNAVEHAIYDVWLVDCKQGPPDTTKGSV
jgi:hypothetical protein